MCVFQSISYLGNGLYAARLATLGALGADGRVSNTFVIFLFVLCVCLDSGDNKPFLVFVFARSRMEGLYQFLPP